MEGLTARWLAGALRLGIALSASVGAASWNPATAANPRVSPAPAVRPLAPVPALLPSVLRPGALATGSLHLVGLRLAAPHARIDAPSGATLMIPVQIMLGSRPATATELAQLLPSGARLEGLFSGPGLPATPITGEPATGLVVPALGAAGDYQISAIRIAKDGIPIVDAPGQTVAIRCLGDVLISSVTSTPMTMDEIRASGIQLGQGDYVATRFTLALAIGSNQVKLKVPVAIPVYNGLEALVGEPSLERLELEGAGAGELPDLQVAVGGISPPGSLTLSRPELAHMARHAFKSLVVIPGSIGYLHQFFKAQVVVLNALPVGNPEYEGYRVGKLTATLAIPAAESSSLIPTGDLIQSLKGQEGDSVGPGQNALATWTVKGVKEGSHQLEFQIQGEFTGGSLTGPVPIVGTARTKVLVRNPKFDLLLVHPDVVRRGEVYTLEARLSNTSGAIANGVSISLDEARLGNVKVVGPATLSVDTLPPGETASLKFRLRALRNGAVLASYLYTEAGGIGFQLATGLGERNVRLNPDTLVLPQTLDTLPLGLRDALLRVLGQAWSVATSKGGLPAGVLPIRASTVTGDLASALSEAGLFLTMGTGRERVWAMLWRAFTQNGDGGFDQLIRGTEAGAELRAELLKARAAWAGSGILTAQLGTHAAWNLESELPVLAAIDGAGAGLQVAFAGADGSLSQADATSASLGAPWSAFAVDGPSLLFQNRFPQGGGQLRLLNAGNASQDLRLALAAPLTHATLAPTLNTYHLVLPPGSSARLEVGSLRGPPVTILLPNGGTASALAETTTDLQVEPFQVLAVHRYDLEMDPNATPFGTHVMVLFNRPNRPVRLPAGEEGFRQGSELVQVEGNALWRKIIGVNPATGEFNPPPPAVVQALPRVVSVYLERPVGPLIPRRLTLAGTWAAADGTSFPGGSYPILCGQIPGGAIVKGKVRRPTGEALPAKLTYWHFVSVDEGGGNIYSGMPFEEDYWALISNNIDVGADGTFQFDYIPERAKTAHGLFTMEAQTAEGKAFGSASVLGNGGALDLDVVLEGRGDVAGRIVDGNGAPLGGVDVALYTEQAASGGTLSLPEGALQRTGADGTFAFPRVKSGVFSLRLRKGDIGAARASAVPAEGGRVDLGDIKLEAATGTLRVTVLNPDGSPCPNQKVLLGITAGLLRTGDKVDFLYVEAAGADANGRIEFLKVPAGDVSAKLPYASGQGPIWYGFLKPGEVLDTTLRLLDPRQLARVVVEVKDSAGVPVTGAGLALQYNANPNVWSAVTDAAGQAVLPAVPDRPFGVTVFHSDWTSAGITSATVTPGSGETVILPVNLPPRCTVTGKVTRPDGSPVAGAYVAIPPVFEATSRNRMVRSDPQGRYRLTGLASDRGERVACVGPELSTAVNQAVQGNAEATLAMDLRLPFEGHNTLTGHVTQPGPARIPAVADLEAHGQLPDISPGQSGNAHWGLPVTLLRGVTRSAADGSYRLDGLPSGPFLLQARSEFFPDWSKVTSEFQGPAETLVRDITLLAKFAGSMEGQLTLPDGQTLVAAGAEVKVTNGAIGNLGVVSTADGRYAFPKVLPAGDYLLRVADSKSRAIAVESVKLAQETNLIHNVRLWGHGKLTVRVQDSLGRILPTAEVFLTHSRQDLAPDDFPSMSHRLLPAENGVVVWEELLEGQIRVQIKDPNGLQGVASTEIPLGGGDVEVTVQLQPVGNVLGLLKRPDGSSVPAGRVDAYLGGRWLGLSNTRQDGVDGRFSFTGLPTGAITLEAWDPDTRQTGKATVQVLEDQTITVLLTTNDLGPVNVRVTKDAAAVDRATLRLNYQAGPALAFSAEGTTDAQGLASFQLPPGDYAAQATDPVTLATGALSFTRNPAQGPMNVDLALRPTRDLAVTVLAPRGWSGPLSGWRVRALKSGTPLRVVSLDASGKAVLTAMMADAYTLAIYDGAGRFRGSRGVSVVDGAGTQTTSLQGLARAPFTITLLDAHGAPVSDGRIQGYAPFDSTVSLQETGTDLQGKVTYPSVLEGVVEARGWSADRRFLAFGSTTLGSEGETATLTLTLGPSARFQGLLSRPGGQPVPWVMVKYRAVGRYEVGQLATDGEGRFGSPTLPLGSYLLSADDGHGRVGSRTVVLDTADQSAPADFTLGGSGHFQGIVRDPLRDPVPPVSVEIWQQNVLLAQTTVDTAGAFRLKDLPTGRTFDLRVRMDDGQTLAHSATLLLETDGATVNRDILLDPRPHLGGHTFAFGGTVHQSMNVRLLDRDGATVLRKAATSADHPTFQLDYVPPGDYELRGYDEVRLLARRAVTVVAAPVLQTADLTALAVRDVKVQLKYPDGSPLAATGHVRLTPVLNPVDLREGELDAAGSLLLRSVTPGDVRIDVTGVANQPDLRLDFTVLAGTEPQPADVPAVGVGSLRVRIQTDAGRPLAGGTLTATCAPSSPTWNAVTQPDGSYLVGAVWVDRPLTLAAVGFGLLKAAPSARIPRHGDTLDILWPAPDQGSVRGVLKGANGLPVAGAALNLDNGFAAAVTDAIGSFRFDGVRVGVDHLLRAEAPGASPEWVTSVLRLGADAEQKNVDLQLPGTGTVILSTRDRRGDPLPAVPVTVTTLDRQAPVKTVTTDAAGRARLEGVMAAAIRAQATLEGRSVEASGVLAASGTLHLNLQAPDATTVNGAIKRAGATALWPAGSEALLNGTRVGLRPDGGLANSLDFLYSATPIAVEVQLPAGGRKFALGSVPMVKNGTTELQLSAPPFGTVALTVRKQDGTPASAARLQGEGGLRAIADAAGKFDFLALDPGTRLFHAVLGDEAGRVEGTLAEDGQTVALAIQLGDRLDISGRYADDLGVPLVLFQDGAKVFGAWDFGGIPYRLEGTVVELAFKGTAKDAAGAVKGSIDAVFSPDGRSFTGSLQPLRFTWNAVRKPGAAVAVDPAAAVQRVATAKPFRAFVAGIADKAVEWTASAGTIAADGAFTAPPAPGTVTLTATSHGDPTQKAEATIQVRLPLTLSPASLTLQPGQQASLAATLTGVEAADLVWSASAGTLVPAGDKLSAAYTAPAAVGTATLTVASSREPAVTATVPITVVSGSILLSPATGQVYAGEKLRVTATVEGLADTTLAWSASAGTITGTGLAVDFTPPGVDGPVTLTATSPSNPAVKGTATFQVVRRGALTLGVRTADGGIVPNRTVSLSWDGGGRSQPINVTTVFTNLPVGTPITLKDTSADGSDPWMPPVPGRTFTLSSGEQKSLDLIVPLGRLALEFSRAGAPMVGVGVGLEVAGRPRTGSTPQSDATGALAFANVPLDVPITASFGWQTRSLRRTFTLTQGETTLPVVWPQNKLTLRLLRGGQPIAGVIAQLAGAVTTWYPHLGPSDAAGLLVIDDLPVDAPFTAILQRGPVEVRRDITLTQVETTLDVEWPPLAKLTVKLQRKNGQPLPATGWQWSASPGGEGEPPATDGPEQTWLDLPRGIEQQVAAEGKDLFNCGEGFKRWKAMAAITPSQAEETRTLTLESLASLRLQFKDRNGLALSGPLHGDILDLQVNPDSGCWGPAVSLTDLDRAAFPEGFPEGSYTISLRSARWGDLDPITFTVGPDDDGREIVVPVTLPWVKTTGALKILAGDHETPVPLARIVAIRADASEVELGRTGREATESGFTGSFLGPEEELQVVARFTPRRGDSEIVSTPAALRSGGTITATLEIPLTVVRTRLLEADGTTLEGQGLLAKGKTELGAAADCPTAVVAGTRYGVLLGEPAAAELELGLYDPDSGLGQRAPALVPALGTNLAVEQRLGAHAWLGAAAFTPDGAPPVASRLLLSLSADAPGLVNPAAASWVRDGVRFAPFRTAGTLSKDGLQPSHGQEFEPAQVPDLANPPQPWTRTLAKVRLPLTGELWAAEWILAGTENRDDLDNLLSVTVSAKPGRWSRQSFTAVAEEAKVLALTEARPLWKATPVQVLDKDGLPPAGSALEHLLLAAWPVHAPADWRLPLPASYQAPTDGGPDAQGLWHPTLPIGTALHLENLPWSCGPDRWWFGSLEFTPADPPPAAPPVLKLSEEKPMPPCLPAPPRAAANRSVGKRPIHRGGSR